MSLLFEVEDLAVASPATVSRCGMVYFDYKDLGWRPYVDSWLSKRTDRVSVMHLNGFTARGGGRGGRGRLGCPVESLIVYFTIGSADLSDEVRISVTWILKHS